MEEAWSSIAGASFVISNFIVVPLRKKRFGHHLFYKRARDNLSKWQHVALSFHFKLKATCFFRHSPSDFYLIHFLSVATEKAIALHAVSLKNCWPEKNEEMNLMLLVDWCFHHASSHTACWPLLHISRSGPPVYYLVGWVIKTTFIFKNDSHLSCLNFE